MDMQQTPLAENGWLKHFTPRDIFYLVGTVASATVMWSALANRVDLVERDFTRFETRTEIKIETLAKELVRLDHDGTTASKNGIYAESAISKSNMARIDAQEQEIKKMSTLLTRIDVNVERLMADANRNTTHIK